MNKSYLFWLILVITLSSIASCGKCDFLSSSEYSGWGYAEGLCFPNAEVEFTIYSSSNQEVNAILRCRCLHLNDAGESLLACVNGNIFSLSLDETTDWQEISIPLVLNEGNNLISFRKSKELYYDICIDYIEL